MAVAVEKLPKRIYLEEYKGNYQAFIDAVFAVFERDFILHKATFGTHKLRMKFHPKFQERPYTFYHMTHSGDVEEERIPDLRRCECIPWARPVVEKAEDFGLKFWEQERNGKHRICIWLETDEDDNYFVVLDVRKTYVLLWTAFCGGETHSVRKKEKEYLEWKELSCKDKEYTPDELVKDIMDRLQMKSKGRLNNQTTS